jgi:mRNA interferase MazF
MKRGEIYFAQLEPARGFETQKTRPVVVVSNDPSNRVAPMVTVIPITKNDARVFSFEVALSIQDTGLKLNGKAMTQQIRALDKSRITSACIGYVSAAKMLAIEAAIKRHLAL